MENVERNTAMITVTTGEMGKRITVGRSIIHRNGAGKSHLLRGTITLKVEKNPRNRLPVVTKRVPREITRNRRREITKRVLRVITRNFLREITKSLPPLLRVITRVEIVGIVAVAAVEDIENKQYSEVN